MGMYRKRIFLLKLCVLYAVFLCAGAYAATPFSQYGLIQNVQNYSSNPFYNPNSPTVSSPHVVYNSGPALKPGDCERVVQSVVDFVCNQHDGCRGMTLADARPELMVQLSKLPGYNYASSCSGYIDGIYEKRQKNNFAGGTEYIATGFPNVQKSAATDTGLPKWKTEYNERAAELKALHEQTNTIPDTVEQVDFPKTFDDLSFEQKIAVKQQGYEKYKDAQVYVPLNIKPEEKNAGGAGGAGGASGCVALYNCIKKYGDAEKSAETAWTNAKKQYDANNAAENKTALDNAKKTMENAWASALFAPCLCKADATYLAKMGMKDVCGYGQAEQQKWLNNKIQQYRKDMGV